MAQKKGANKPGRRRHDQFLPGLLLVAFVSKYGRSGVVLSLSYTRRALPVPRLASPPRPPDTAMEDPAMDNPLDPRIPRAALLLRPAALPPLSETHMCFRGDPFL